MELKEQVDEIRQKALGNDHRRPSSQDVLLLIRYIDNQQEQIAELSKAHTFCDRHNEDDIDPCPNCTIEKMDNELTDWRDGHERVINEQCAPDEKHCNCVPSLRKRIAELEDEKNKIADVFQIGSAVRDVSTILVNAENATRRSSLLSVIENLHDRLNWGASFEGYKEKYLEVVDSIRNATIEEIKKETDCLPMQIDAVFHFIEWLNHLLKQGDSDE